MSENRLKSLVRDIVATMGRHLVTIATGFVLVFVLARGLGRERFGFFSVAMATAMLLPLCDLGLSTATLRASTGRDPAVAKRIARFGFSVGAVLASGVAVLCGLVLSSSAHRLPEGEHRNAQVAVVLLLTGGIIVSAGQSWRAYAQGRGRLVELASARIAASAVQLAVTLIGLRHRLSLCAPALGFALGSAVESLWFLRAARDGVRPAETLAPEDRLEARRAAGAAFVIGVAVFLSGRADVMVLEASATLEVLAAYALTQRLIDQGFVLIKQVGAALLPRLGLRSSDRSATARFGLVLMSTAAGAPLGAAAVGGQSVLVLWAGPVANHAIVTPVMALLAGAAILSACSETPAAALSMSADSRGIARAVVSGSLVNFGLSVLGARLGGGAVAVAGATLAGNVIIAVMVARQAITGLGWTVGNMLRSVWPAGIGGAASALSTGALCFLGIPALLACVAGVSVGYACSWAVLPMRWLRRSEACA